MIIYKRIYSIVFFLEYIFMLFFLFSFLLVLWKMEDYMSMSEGWKSRCINSQLWRKPIFSANFSPRQRENNFDLSIHVCAAFFSHVTHAGYSRSKHILADYERERARARKDEERYTWKLSFDFKPIYADKQRFRFMICIFFRGEGRSSSFFNPKKDLCFWENLL